MRYAKGGLVINPERDIPLLRQVRNSRFVSHSQLFELMKFGGSDRSRDSFNWRVRRLAKSGHISICGGIFCAGSAVYRITKEGLACSNIMASSLQSCNRIPSTCLTLPRFFTRSN